MDSTLALHAFRDEFATSIRKTHFSALSPVIDNRYHLLKMIGKGSFGAIFLTKDTHTGEYYATKVENILSGKVPLLRQEYEKYRMLAGGSFAAVHRFWECSSFHGMMMTLYGPSLEKLRLQTGGHFSIGTVTKLALATLKQVEELHQRNFIHRDIKPENFVVDPVRKEEVSLIDLGLAKCFIDPVTQLHIPPTEKHKFIGTPRFASVNAHLGLEPSRRDDLISLGYLFCYLRKGKLPWQHSPMDPNGNENIMHLKSATTTRDLFVDMPPVFHHFFDRVSRLRFDEEPNYGELRTAFEKHLEEYGGEEHILDWIREPQSYAIDQPSTPAPLAEPSHLPPYVEPLSSKVAHTWLVSVSGSASSTQSHFSPDSHLQTSASSGSSNGTFEETPYHRTRNTSTLSHTPLAWIRSPSSSVVTSSGGTVLHSSSQAGVASSENDSVPASAIPSFSRSHDRPQQIGCGQLPEGGVALMQAPTSQSDDQEADLQAKGINSTLQFQPAGQSSAAGADGSGAVEDMWGSGALLQDRHPTDSLFVHYEESYSSSSQT